MEMACTFGGDNPAACHTFIYFLKHLIFLIKLLKIIILMWCGSDEKSMEGFILDFRRTYAVKTVKKIIK